MARWSMRKEREFMNLAGKLSVEQIATRLGFQRVTILKMAKRLGINLDLKKTKPRR